MLTKPKDAPGFDYGSKEIMVTLDIIPKVTVRLTFAFDQIQEDDTRLRKLPRSFDHEGRRFYLDVVFVHNKEISM